VTPTAFKVAILEGAGRMSGPFGFDEIASDMGSSFATGEPGEGRLRRALRTLCRSGVITAEARGVYRFVGDGGAGPGVVLVRQVEAFMQENGGIARASDMREALDLDDTADRRRLHRLLERSRFENMPTMSDGRSLWVLPDAERLALPLPGWRIEADLSVEAFRAGRPWRRLSVNAINGLRRDIGLGVRAAREAAGLSISEVLAAVEPMFVADLRRGLSPVLSPRSSGAIPIKTWWADQAADLGQMAAMIAWAGLERGGGVGTPWAGSALSSATWVTLASALDTDPATLSRGHHGLG